MDLWASFEEGALAVLEREVKKTSVDRPMLERGLHLLAIAKSKDPNAPMPPLQIFTDVELAQMVEALLKGERPRSP
jgi:hypothetical protein